MCGEDVCLIEGENEGFFINDDLFHPVNGIDQVTACFVPHHYLYPLASISIIALNMFAGDAGLIISCSGPAGVATSHPSLRGAPPLSPSSHEGAHGLQTQPAGRSTGDCHFIRCSSSAYECIHCHILYNFDSVLRVHMVCLHVVCVSAWVVNHTWVDSVFWVEGEELLVGVTGRGVADPSERADCWSSRRPLG